jgi:stress-induced morphogen
MWTKVDAVEVHSSIGQQLAEALVDGFHALKIKVSATHTRLVRNDGKP